MLTTRQCGPNELPRPENFGRLLPCQVKNTSELSFMVNDRFSGKLERYLERAGAKARENDDIFVYITDGETVGETTMHDVHGTTKVLDELQEELQSIDQLVRRMRALETEDPPSQD